jgi:formaldehyde-activating enzyme involved in methanogenesis
MFPSIDLLLRGDIFMIEVFVHSSSVYMDVETVREMSQHAYCASGVASGLLKNVASQFKGRILPQDDYVVLQRIAELAYELHDDVKVYDVSRVQHKMRALKHGILKTPVVIVQGKKHEGLDKILELLP